MNTVRQRTYTTNAIGVPEPWSYMMRRIREIRRDWRCRQLIIKISKLSSQPPDAIVPATNAWATPFLPLITVGEALQAYEEELLQLCLQA